MEGVHDELVDVMYVALTRTPVDFMVIEGLRTTRRQRELYTAGKSKTMNSRHLTGHALDLVPIIDGRISWDWKDFYKLEPAIKDVAHSIGVPIEWGGDWKSFPDAPHWQLPWKEYPK